MIEIVAVAVALTGAGLAAWARQHRTLTRNYAIAGASTAAILVGWALFAPAAPHGSVQVSLMAVATVVWGGWAVGWAEQLRWIVLDLRRAAKTRQEVRDMREAFQRPPVVTFAQVVLPDESLKPVLLELAQLGRADSLESEALSLPLSGQVLAGRTSARLEKSSKLPIIVLRVLREHVVLPWLRIDERKHVVVTVAGHYEKLIVGEVEPLRPRVRVRFRRAKKYAAEMR